MTGADLNSGTSGTGTTYAYAASYDDDLRLLSSGVTVAGPGGATLYGVALGYDANSNVTGVDTTLGTGTTTSTDNQAFCYDDLDRLTWASSATASGPDAPGTTTPCASNTAGTLNGQNALYTASYAYDNLDRLTTGPADGGSSYTYGDPAHLHAATSTSGGYSATYDAAGNMTCRAPNLPTGAATCTGSSPTGQGLTYDHEGQLTGWTSALHGTPTPNTAAFAYDGEGSRVAMQSTNGALGTTTTTDYLLGGLEEQQAVGGTHPSSSLTEYYPLPGIGTAVRVTANGTGTSTLSYLASDGLGSVTVALSTTGSVTAQALYSPYGTVRYASGTMPTAHGYTGQLADAMTGLSYYGARYYDPALGQFASADSMLDGLNRYAYVGGNPESATDPSGHSLVDDIHSAFMMMSPAFLLGQQNGQAVVTLDMMLGGIGDPFAFDFTTGDGQTVQVQIEGDDENYFNLSTGQSSSANSLVSEDAALRAVGASDTDLPVGVEDSAVRTQADDVRANGLPKPSDTDTDTPPTKPTTPTDPTKPTSTTEPPGGPNDPPGGQPQPGDQPPIKPGSANGPTAGQPFPASVKQQAYQENPSETCVYCHRTGVPTAVDHAWPKSLGGNATFDNAQIACRWCNGSKNNAWAPRNPPPGYEGAWPPDYWPDWLLIRLAGGDDE